MLLTLSEEHKKHLKFFSELGVDVLNDFLRLALQFIKSGVNTKVFPGAAEKLGVAVTDVKNGVEGLMHFLTECSKTMISELDFQDSALLLGFSEEMIKELLQVYLDNRKEIRQMMSDISMDLPHYQDLEWRLDVQVSSRTLKRQTEPDIVMKLVTSDDGQSSAKVLETDPVNLLHLTNRLEAALRESRSQHCRRIMRNIK